MKAYRFVLALMILLPFTASDVYSQKWLKKIGEVLETTNEILDAGSSSSKSRAEKSSVRKVKEVETYEVSYVGDASAERRGGAFKIVTNHPDFKVKVKRCEVSGTTCVIDMLFENVGDNDVEIRLGSFASKYIAYDDEANQYNDIQITTGDFKRWEFDTVIKLMSQVPIKARIQIENVAEEATVFRRLEYTINCRAWSLGENKPLKFVNLPISREGE